MAINPDLQLLAHTLALARTRRRPGPRPARQVAMAARRRTDESLHR